MQNRMKPLAVFGPHQAMVRVNSLLGRMREFLTASATVDAQQRIGSQRTGSLERKWQGRRDSNCGTKHYDEGVRGMRRTT